MGILEVAITIIGSGTLSAIATIIYQKRMQIKQLDHNTRQLALQQFQKAYASISRLTEYTQNYIDSKPNGKKTIWNFKEEIETEHTTDEIWQLYQDEYNTFTKIFITLKKEGYELFINKKLTKNLECFWRLTREFHEDKLLMENLKKNEEFSNHAFKTTECMEKMFGLTNN